MTTGDDDFKAEMRARLAEGSSSFDPSANVLALVAAAMQRQDDLRKMEGKWRTRGSKQERLHRRELRDMETKARDAQLLAEKARIDALLSEAKANVALATTRTEFTAAALAERVDTTAKTLASTVEAIAKTLAATVEATATRLAERIEPLERARYEQAGSKEQRTEGRADNRWVIGLVMAAPSFLVALVAAILLLVQ